MGVIKFKGEYKVTLLFETERDDNTRPLDELQKSVGGFQGVLLNLLEDVSDESVGVIVEELSSYIEEA